MKTTKKIIRPSFMQRVRAFIRFAPKMLRLFWEVTCQNYVCVDLFTSNSVDIRDEVASEFRRVVDRVCKKHGKTVEQRIEELI